MAVSMMEQMERFLGVTNRRQTVLASNMANVNTPGYSRQIVNLSAEALGSGVDGGVSYGGYTSVRDELLQMSVDGKTAEQGSLNTQATALATVQTAFSGTTTGVGAAMSTFFSAVSGLSTNPMDSSARQAVMSAASQLASAFHQGASALTDAAAQANTLVGSTVAQINATAKQIASLNDAIAQQTSAGEPGGTLQDQRDQLTTQLAQLVGVSRTQTEGQPTLTTADGSPLVVGGKAYTLQVATGADGSAHVLDSNGADLTSRLTGGSLGGALTTRDATVPGVLAQLNTLATQFSDAVKTAQANGFDVNGAPGAAIFAISGANASAGITVALGDASGIAASSGSGTGSSGNVPSLLAIQTTTLAGGQTPTDAYAALVTDLGTTGSDVSAKLKATTTALQQLTSQQSAQSGVSIDEESTNLIRYQQAYTAAAHVISTINDLFTVVMNMTAGG